LNERGTPPGVMELGFTVKKKKKKGGIKAGIEGPPNPNEESISKHFRKKTREETS